MVEVFLDQKDKRDVVLRAFKREEEELLVVFLAFLERVIKLAYARSEPAGAFGAYARQLDVLIDLLVVVDPARSPALFRTLADALSRLASYVGKNKGQSWEAADLWDRRRAAIPANVIVDLRGYATNNFTNIDLQRLLLDKWPP